MALDHLRTRRRRADRLTLARATPTGGETRGARIEIRRVLGREAVSLRELRLRALADAPAAFASAHRSEAAHAESYWHDLAVQSEQGEAAIVFIAQQRCRWVGMAAARWSDRDQAIVHLWGMWVDPALRRHGLGERLVGAVHGWAATQGARSLRLGVIADVAGVREFYARLGFVPTGETKPLVRDPGRSAVFLVRAV